MKEERLTMYEPPLLTVVQFMPEAGFAGSIEDPQRKDDPGFWD